MIVMENLEYLGKMTEIAQGYLVSICWLVDSLTVYAQSKSFLYIINFV